MKQYHLNSVEGCNLTSILSLRRLMMEMQFKHGFGLGLVMLLVMVALSSIVIPVVLADQTGNNATKGKLLYEENFSSSKGSVWSGDLSANFSYYFDNGKYHLNVNQMNSLKDVSSGQNYNNSILEVEATEVAGPNDNIYGVMVRKVDWNNYYIFAISGTVTIAWPSSRITLGRLQAGIGRSPAPFTQEMQQT